ncbi:hypothetical protein N7474_009851 [Penicillium riverlandense]|uniref:uncharacterized protein n=1 Tax=Penicillium riverlandense TaxID=1903569 RepID=UPI002549AD27|nr:uncharacterized protein N7474_009851 [Penicillium riverlandense]KAJ5808582.1 hypothetical protein N7474_009851 [Penicillium riverlandense]
MTSEDFAAMGHIIVDSKGNHIGSNLNDIDTAHVRRDDQFTAFRQIDDPNPHQNYMITQKGGTVVNCPGTTTSGLSQGFSWAVSGGIVASFLNAGFFVSETTTVSNTASFECASDTDSICVLFYQAVTAYTVEVQRGSFMGFSSDISWYDDGTTVIYAPNSGSLGSTTGRGINVNARGITQCWGDDDRTVTFACGPPGDADYWNYQDPGPWNSDYVANMEPAGCAIPIEAFRFTDV